MKKVISGHVYDSDKANALGTWSNTYPVNDFHFCEETLHRTKSGLYFLHGEGGALSPYAQPADGSGWMGGELIRPLTVDEAKEWAEDKLDGDTYVEIFGDPESDELRTINVKLNDAAYRKLRDLSAENGETMGEVISRLVLDA